MATELIVPKLGMAAAEVTLTEWKAKEGARVEKGDNVLDIEAEKSAFEMTAPVSGFLHILMEPGAETDVNTVVALIAESEEEYASLAGSVCDDPARVQESAKAAPAPSPEPAAGGSGEDRIFITPIARRIASEHGVDYSQIAGTGPRGRIQRDDVRKFIGGGGIAAPSVASSHAPNAPHPGLTASKTLPYAGMRKAIGENMMRSLAINAPNTMSGDFDMTVMARYRDNFVQHETKLGTRITYADLVIHAVAKALRAFPLMNSSLIGNEIRLWDEINIGMAVALGEHGEKGLVVPVIRNAGRLSLVELSKAAKDLGKRAREGTLSPEELTGGTFTVSNFGSLGVSSYSTPIINPPESGIIGIGRLQKKPIVRNDGIVVAPMLPYSLTHDHRIVDGAAAERFLSILKDNLETTSAELNELILF